MPIGRGGYIKNKPIDSTIKEPIKEPIKESSNVDILKKNIREELKDKKQGRKYIKFR